MEEILSIYSYIWLEEKDDWVVYEVHEGDSFLYYLIFNTRKNGELKMRNPEDTYEFVRFINSKGIPIVKKQIDDIYD